MYHFPEIYLQNIRKIMRLCWKVSFYSGQRYIRCEIISCIDWRLVFGDQCVCRQRAPLNWFCPISACRTFQWVQVCNSFYFLVWVAISRTASRFTCTCLFMLTQQLEAEVIFLWLWISEDFFFYFWNRITCLCATISFYATGSPQLNNVVKRRHQFNTTVHSA